MKTPLVILVSALCLALFIGGAARADEIPAQLDQRVFLPALSRAPTAVPPRATVPPPTAPPGSQPTTVPVTNPVFVGRLLDLANAERARIGCAPVILNDNLNRASHDHAVDMAMYEYISHTSLDGRTPTDRARAAGYTGAVAEIAGAGWPTPEIMMENWLGSPNHRPTVVNCSYTEAGIGYLFIALDDLPLQAWHYWVMLFGHR